MIHTCPRCELRFERNAELRYHLARDHGVDTGPMSPATTRAGAVEIPAARGRRVLVMANRTLHSEELPARLRRVRRPGPDPFLPPRPADAGAGETPDEAGRLADSRLRHLVDRFHDEGIDAEGVVGDPDPSMAVERLLERERFDEILLSTLRPGRSRGPGLRPRPPPRRIFQLPVTRVEATV